jgi:hypothetical protein
MKLSVATIMKQLGLQAMKPEQIAGHEDNIGENVLVPILGKLGYNHLDIERKPSLSHAIVGEIRAPDFGICRYQDEPRRLFGMVADVKASDVTLGPNLEEKLAGYCGLAGASYGQGQRSLKRCPGKYFQQEIVAPAATATFHGDAVLTRVLL